MGGLFFMGRYMRRLLSVIALSLALAVPPVLALADEVVLEGVLEEGDLMMDGEGALASYKDLYEFSAVEGREVRLFVEMEDMQPHIAILDKTGKLIDKTMSNLYYYAQWDWKAPKAGTYQILITTTYKARQPYRLTFTDLPPGTIPPCVRACG
jgi:hypothetical protein